MKAREAAKAIPARFRRPAIWGTCLAWVVLTKVTYLVTDARLDATSHHFLMPIARVLDGLFDAIIAVVLGPFAWQWTGDDRPMGNPGRSLIQVLGVIVLGTVVLKIPLGLLVPDTNRGGPDPLGVAMVMMVGLAIFLIVALAGRAIAWNEHQEEVRRQSLAQAHEAQWTLLRSQLSPHLVLNALNGLAGLAEEDPAKAARGLEDLAEVYQQLLELGKAERIPLARERELVERYLNVEQLRLEKGLSVTWHWDEALDGMSVPPLLLQPLVENAIKHGISVSPDRGKLVIYARKAGTLVALDVSNTGGALHLRSPLTGAGVGIRNLRHRLELAYGDRATLSLLEDGPWTRATILIPATKPSLRGDIP